MARRKTANCTFKFSFPLLPPPPPPLRQNSPTNSRKIVGLSGGRGECHRVEIRAWGETQLVRATRARGIYITRGYWRGFLTRRQNIDTTTDILVCSFALPPSTISTGNRRYPRNDVEWRWNERQATLRIRATEEDPFIRESLSLSLLFLSFHSLEKAGIELPRGEA